MKVVFNHTSVHLETHQLYKSTEVVQRLRNGEREAQYEVYSNYCDAMFNVCLRIVNQREDAEDVLQEAFVSAFKNIRSFKEESTIGTWLKRIVVNHSLNFIKKKKLKVSLLDENMDKAEETEMVDDSNIQYQVENIKTAMKKLSDGYRSVLSLYLFEGYSHEEIGEILNCSTGTSKSQYHRAKKKLIELMQ